MKIQCPCGAKYAFEITPEMARRPVQFVCQLCGADSSAAINEMIRNELNERSYAPPAAMAEAAAPPVAAPAPPPVRVAAPPPRVVAPPPSSPAETPAAAAASAPVRVPMARLQVARPATAADDATEASPSSETAARKCVRHPGQFISNECLVCKKPMCPKCMELFGYFCSPFCRNKAEAAGMDMPEYAGQRSVAERRKWRKVGLVGAGIGAVFAALIGFWIWYGWFGQVPRPVFKVRFPESSYSGQSQLIGRQQIVFLHGDTLARHDMNSKKEVWSRNLVDKKKIEADVEEEIKATKKLIDKANLEAWDDVPKMPSPEKLTRRLTRAAAAELQLMVFGSNVWVASPERIVRYDWETGDPAQQIPLTAGFGTFIPKDNELLMREENEDGQLVITHISLTTGETRVEKIGAAPKAIASMVSAGKAPPAPPRGAPGGGTAPAGGTAARGAGAGGRGQPTAGLPLGKPGADRGKPLDPQKVAEQASRLSGPGKMALPATLSNARNQERIMNELDDRPGSPAAAAAQDHLHAETYFTLVPSKYGYVQFGAKLLEEIIVTRKAMKDPPKKSALDGNVNASQSMAVANEILNEMQRDRGGATVEEDMSRYRAVVRRMDGTAEDWSGEVIGPPSVHPLKTVNLVASSTEIIVLDKMNKLMWKAGLSHRVSAGSLEPDDEKEESTRGEGPCVERGDRLYVYDQAVLTAFELSSGNVLWRVPSVGISAMFFDQKGMLYLNTTSADPETLKYSKQIDVEARNGPIVMKIDPKSGKILWASNTCGFISYLSGKYIFAISAGGYSPDEDEEVSPYGSSGVAPAAPFFQIRRINPSNGRQMWVYNEERIPFDLQFKDNYIHLVFKKEVEVLKFFTF